VWPDRVSRPDLLCRGGVSRVRGTRDRPSQRRAPPRRAAYWRCRGGTVPRQGPRSISKVMRVEGMRF